MENSARTAGERNWRAASWPSVGRPKAGARSRSCRCRTIPTRRRWPRSRSSLRPFRRWFLQVRRATSRRRWREVADGRGFPAAGRRLRRKLRRARRQQHPRLLPRVPADGGGAHLCGGLAGGEDRPHRRPVRQAAHLADREARRRRAAGLSRRHHQRHRVHARGAHSRSAPPDRGLSAIGRDAQPAARVRDRRLRQSRQCAPVDARLRQGQPAVAALRASSPTASPRRSASCRPAGSISRAIRSCARPISTPATRRCCSASSRR